MKAWLLRHPVVMGAFFAALAFFAFREGVDNAKEQRRFAGATPVSAEVVGISKKSSVPPRWNAEVAWGTRAAARSATVVVGATRWTEPQVSLGQSLEILVAPDDPAYAIAARRLKDASMVKLGGLEVDADEFWIGLLFAAGALLTFAFAGTIKRQADELFG